MSFDLVLTVDFPEDLSAADKTQAVDHAVEAAGLEIRAAGGTVQAVALRGSAPPPVAKQSGHPNVTVDILTAVARDQPNTWVPIKTTENIEHARVLASQLRRGRRGVPNRPSGTWEFVAGPITSGPEVGKFAAWAKVTPDDKGDA